jgi:hypothetical protein
MYILFKTKEDINEWFWWSKFKCRRNA